MIGTISTLVTVLIGGGYRQPSTTLAASTTSWSVTGIFQRPKTSVDSRRGPRRDGHCIAATPGKTGEERQGEDVMVERVVGKVMHAVFARLQGRG